MTRLPHLIALCDAVAEHHAIFERRDPLPLREAAWNDMARAAQNAIPELKALLQQLADARALADKWDRECYRLDPPGPDGAPNRDNRETCETLYACASELRAIFAEKEGTSAD